MKRIGLIFATVALVATVGLVVGNAPDSGEAGEVAMAEMADMETAVFTVANMTCATCPITVRKAIAGVEGVSSVEVDFEAQSATVVFDPELTTTELIGEASASAGYPAATPE